jgi:hypothetical protein
MAISVIGRLWCPAAYSGTAVQKRSLRGFTTGVQRMIAAGHVTVHLNLKSAQVGSFSSFCFVRYSLRTPDQPANCAKVLRRRAR